MPPAQDYREIDSGRPPGTKEVPDLICSKDAEGCLETNTCAKTAYLSGDASDDDYFTQPKRDLGDDAADVVLIADDGQPKLNPEGKPIMMKGIGFLDLHGKTFLQREDDGTRNGVRIFNAVDDNCTNDKEFTKFKIRLVGQ